MQNSFCSIVSTLLNIYVCIHKYIYFLWQYSKILMKKWNVAKNYELPPTINKAVISPDDVECARFCFSTYCQSLCLSKLKINHFQVFSYVSQQWPRHYKSERYPAWLIQKVTHIGKSVKETVIKTCPCHFSSLNAAALFGPSLLLTWIISIDFYLVPCHWSPSTFILHTTNNVIFLNYSLIKELSM